jgi:orotate phosphoribosyltransferase-like protein
MKIDKIADQAAQMYADGMSVEAIAAELDVAYRTARKALWSKGVEFRDPSARLLGRTRPDKRTAAVT